MNTEKMLVGVAGFVFALFPSIVIAHCDTLDGPVIKDAKFALEKSDISPVLKWVQKENEKEIRNAFKKTLAVREKGTEAKELADMYFFETLVRVHRAGEGAPYTGLKPAGSESNPAVVAADKAIEKGTADEIIKLINNAAEKGLKQRFNEVMEAKENMDKNPEAGRKYVAAYVEFIHYGQRLYDDAAAKTDHAHGQTQEAAAGHEHHD